jgi:hypothetical protein
MLIGLVGKSAPKAKPDPKRQRIKDSATPKNLFLIKVLLYFLVIF